MDDSSIATAVDYMLRQIKYLVQQISDLFLLFPTVYSFIATVDEVYIPINCGDEFHWVLVVVVLKVRPIRVYDSMSQRRHFGPLSEIQKLTKLLPTYLDMSDFLDKKIHNGWSTIEAYRDKMGNFFDVQYVEGIVQQTIGNLDCGPFVAAYAEYLSDELQIPNDELYAGLLYKIYVALLWKYGEVKAQKSYASDIKDSR
ncbi:hypothetical protein CQW23_27115 [Capsicum baccatum]|uniref:Ubiquitin-like protease family profile domain-containing protein n=1 Tax=Capsicum baccatum TaxID=33114 RepID=A0A2G2VQR6_CAPBA|nr:hypothetical protein CQW23_27115 [Capsicum baccatum]